MPRVILIDPCLDPRWDAFVESHPFGWVTHLSAWKRVLETSFPHMRGHYLALVDEGGQIQAGLPLFEVRSPITGNRLVSTPFATLSDPLVSQKWQVSIFCDYAAQLLRKLGGSFMEMRSHAASDYLVDPRLSGLRTYQNHYMLLNKDPDDLFRSFHKSCVRARVSRAAKLPFELSFKTEAHVMKEFYSLYVLTRKRLGLPPQPLAFFIELEKRLGPRGAVLFPIARLAGRAVGGLMLFMFKGRVSCEAVGVAEGHRSSGVSFLLLWEAIKLAHEQGFKVFDFGRTAQDNHGLMTFKSRWGTKVVDLPQFFLYNGKASAKAGLFSSKNAALRRLCSKLPMPLFKALGNFCYRHMG